ncbi:MAG: valine--tRNA ligase [Rhodospirillales bacterium]|nr:valine--tRNA ligase [Rhodospirillales bacterium]
MLEKTYDANGVEQNLYEDWDRDGSFSIGSRDNAQPYTIVIPPPNVTGSLHMGHALNNTLQDILIRHERMKGRDALWQPGMDHAGIATQMVVERQLAEQGLDRREMGREAFIDKVWTWKGESGGLIGRQLRRLGASADWSRERFTMDEGLSEAVIKVFVDLYEAGLIYKDKRLVNWDPRLLTAISDLEVQQQEVKGHLWHFRYPVEGEDGRFITVATTRPETMLGDTAVAVHPDDERYRDLVGKHAILPLVGRRIVIVADEYADPEQGSGAVKITPAHDFNDFEVGKRHNLEMINILDAEARINENAPAAYRGLDRFEARERIVADMEADGFLETIDEHLHQVPFGDRGGVPIEPWLTEQWYADARTLAEPAIRAVEEGKTCFVPENWTRTYYEWMRNIQPWCISRQLWWGHQIPAWYGPDGEVFVAHDEEAARLRAREHYGEDVPLERDPDVLDTWFSSALWPFSTLGWPEDTPELRRYYPTDVLVTGFDIIFFWVARMMMMGLHFMKEVPFHTVYIHALVRDEKGAKMSKSKGNIIDPLELIDEYGADALRFTLCAMAVPGRDIKLSKQRVEGYRNFGTKLWNAARYCEMNGCVADSTFDPSTCRETVNRWIASEMARLRIRLDVALAAYRFNDGAQAAYQAAWNVFCDWYLEFTKPILNSDDEAAAAETRAATGWALDQLLLMLHPIMPFITEELWRQLDGHRETRLIRAGWPTYGEEAIDVAASNEMDWIVRLISLIRTIRAEVNVPAGARIVALLKDGGAEAEARMARHRDLILRLARLESIDRANTTPAGSAQAVFDGATLILPLEDVIDIAAEVTRLKKAIGKADGEVAGLGKKLSNEKFLANAPDEVVEENRERLAAAEQSRDRLAEALARLEAA